MDTTEGEGDRAATRDQILWRIDSMITWEAPDCALPAALEGPELNILVGKGAYMVEGPRHCIRIGFEINAPDEATALGYAREELLRDFRIMEDRHPGDDLPESFDLHPDRMVLDRLAVRQVAADAKAVPGAAIS